MYEFGLAPHNIHRLKGMLLMPFVHADAEHLWGNTIQLFFTIMLVFIHYKHMAKYVVVWQWLIPGLLLFFLGKSGSTHIGSSGVVYGLFGFLICAGFMASNRRLRLLSFMLLMYYGSMIWGLFPWQEKVSWEGHLSGVMGGISCAIALRPGYRKFTRDNKPSWFDEKDRREDLYARFNKSN